ncbi:MAG: hypothetical protein SGILL_001690 [Bacillariaceae sp.]
MNFATSSSSPGGNTSWDAHYRRKGRTRERFDYAHTSEELSPELPQEYKYGYEYTSSGGHPRTMTMSADPTPQYHHQNPSGGVGSAAASVSTNNSKNRATCLNMFNPGEDAGPPPSTVMSDADFQYYSQEQQERRLTYGLSAGAYTYSHDDMSYGTGRQRAVATTNSGPGNGRSLTPTRLRYGHGLTSTLPQHSYRSTTMEAAATTTATQHSSHRSRGASREAKSSILQPDRSRYTQQDYLKENLIMYGEGLQDAPSASTGLSQEELLQRKRREETWKKRREKRHHKKNRVVNLPSSLFSTHSSRQQEQPQYQQQHMQLQRQMQPQPSAYTSTNVSNERFSEDALPLTGNGSDQLPVAEFAARGGGGASSDDKATAIGSNTFSGGKGVRGLMMRRQRSDHSSSGRRWKILPNLAGAAKSESVQSENTGRKQDPPAASASSRTKYPRDPPSVHSGKGASVSGDSKGSRGEEVQLENPSADDFDRFMENPDLMLSTQATPSISYEPATHNQKHDYLASKAVKRNSPPRPSYASFSPKSEYSISHDPYPSNGNPADVNDVSPTSVMDVRPRDGSVGVRWSQNLTEQQFLSPESSKLDPFGSDPIRNGSHSKPKSILRKGSARHMAGSARGTQDFLPYDEAKEYPSGEFPKKVSRKNENLSSSDGGPCLPRSSSPVDFVDGDGRSVSPIVISESPSADDDFPRDPDSWTTERKWDRQAALNEKDGVPQFEGSFLPENPNPVVEDGSGQLSNSYVDFIEAVASVVIQTKVRQLLARIRVENMRSQRTSIGQDRGAVLPARPTTSRERRSHAMTQKARNAYRPKTSPKNEAALDFYTLAAIRIQAIFRGWWVRDCLAVDNYCATMIQKTYRGWRAVDAVITRVYCVIRIQSIMRGFLSRKQLQYTSPEHDYRDVAATMIQAQWRSFSCEMKFLRFYEDLLIVQSVVRGWITRRLIRLWLMAHNQNIPRTLNESTGNPSDSTNSRLDQLTPPRTPSKSRAEISPSYQPHIEYMRQTLTPESVPDQEPSVKAVPLRRDLGKSHSVTEDLLAKITPSKTSADGVEKYNPTIETAKVSRWQGSRSRGSGTHSQDHRHEGESRGTAAASRSEIEQRRKVKELETKARQDEEKRRKEAQATELAELEFRRKRMAMKAEARKQEKPSPEERNVDFAPVAFDCLPHHEEKKDSDSVLQSAPSSGQSQLDSDREKTDGSISNTASSPSNRTKTNFGPWQLKKRSVAPTSAYYKSTETPSSLQDQDEEPKTTKNDHMTNSANDVDSPLGEDQASGEKYGSRPPFTQIAHDTSAMKQQLFTSVENETRGDKQEVSSTDVEEMNSIVGKSSTCIPKQVSDESKQSESHTTATLSENNVVSQALGTPAGKAPKHSVVENAKSKDVDVSALTDPTASPSTVATPSSTKRLNHYQEQMRSNRSESEQKRLDEMRSIFQKAGLMSRTKLSAKEKYARKNVAEDQASAQDLLVSWQAKDQTQRETTGKLF